MCPRRGRANAQMAAAARFPAENVGVCGEVLSYQEVESPKARSETRATETRRPLRLKP
jgi:hypothetical protein